MYYFVFPIDLTLDKCIHCAADGYFGLMSFINMLYYSVIFTILLNVNLANNMLTIVLNIIILLLQRALKCICASL